MKIMRIVFRVVSVILSALAGNWIGGLIRAEQTGQPVNTLVTEFSVGARRYRNFPSLSRFFPAVIMGAMAKPNWFWAAAAGVLTGWLVDEQYEQAVLSRIFAFLEEE